MWILLGDVLNFEGMSLGHESGVGTASWSSTWGSLGRRLMILCENLLNSVQYRVREHCGVMSVFSEKGVVVEINYHLYLLHKDLDV